MSAKGIAVDNEKVKAIKEMKPPTNVNRVQQLPELLTGCVNFFINCTTLAHPLTELIERIKFLHGQKRVIFF